MPDSADYDGPEIVLALKLPIPGEEYRSWPIKREADSYKTEAAIEEAFVEMKEEIWELLYGG